MQKTIIYLPTTIFLLGENAQFKKIFDFNSSILENKIALLFLQESAIIRNSIKKGDKFFIENDIKIETSITKIKQFYKLEATKISEMKEKLQSMIGKFFIKDIEIDNKDLKITISKDFFIWKEEQSTGCGKDFALDLNDLRPIKALSSLFMKLTADFYGTANFNNIELLKTLGFDHSTPNKIKNKNKDLRESMKRLGYKFEKVQKGNRILITKPETLEKPKLKANKEEKEEAQPAVAKATENAAESTESNENGFNGLDAWQDVLKRPEIDFEFEAETLFENEKTEEELLDELDF
ncbi:hypothetical protein OPW36_14155 [Vibrio europaeus]|uniref:hypothetical protein n=1 Tax=Vibrio europaeus TaxID=300876 RepID=UPI00233F103C|nr:hypothetical protein [Vibrio europaeus]MDC5825854.1 hypothetical protein [Vibrio europaeus]CAH6858954.1 conserved hypothetical protein [Vibrio chagasii]